VVIVGGEMREEIEPCGEEDLLEPFEAWIPFAMLDGTDGASRRTGSLGQLHLGEPRELTGLHHQCRREGRHSPTDASIGLVVVGQVTEIRMDASHICNVPDPRREIPGACRWPEGVRERGRTKTKTKPKRKMKTMDKTVGRARTRMTTMETAMTMTMMDEDGRQLQTCDAMNLGVIQVPI